MVDLFPAPVLVNDPDGYLCDLNTNSGGLPSLSLLGERRDRFPSSVIKIFNIMPLP
jgi:hypothetical protein